MSWRLNCRIGTLIFSCGLAVAVVPNTARAAASTPYTEHVQQQGTRILTFSAPTSGHRIIRNISCIVQLTAKQPQTPVLIIGSYGAPDFQVIYTPMIAAGSSVSINTAPILAYVNPGDTVTFEAGLPNDVPVNLGCTLTGESIS